MWRRATRWRPTATRRLQAEHGEWYAQHSKMVHYINAMFPYLMGKPEDSEAHNGK